DAIYNEGVSARYCDWIWRRRYAILAVAIAVTGAAGALASRLELRTNFAELLPSRDPAVAELERLSKRVGGTAILQIAVEGPDRLRAASAGLDQLPAGYCEGEGGRLVAIVCRPPGGLFAERAGERLVAEARRLIAAARPSAHQRVRLTGDVTAQLEERQALE